MKTSRSNWIGTPLINYNSMSVLFARIKFSWRSGFLFPKLLSASLCGFLLCRGFAQDSPQSKTKMVEEGKIIESQARTLSGEWERISPDVDIGYADLWVFGEGVRVAPKKFYLGQRFPEDFTFSWSWEKFEVYPDRSEKLAIEPPKGVLPRPFRIEKRLIEINFHILSTGNKAEVWVMHPKAKQALESEASLKELNGEKFDMVFAGYYRQIDSINRWEVPKQ